MDSVSSELLNLLYKLLPGFVAAGVLYHLTAHRKETPFERVIEAMIFTVIIQVFVVILRALLIFVGGFYSLANWSDNTELVVSVLLAVAMGMWVARRLNNNTIHEWLRSWPWYDRLREKCGLRWLPEWHWTCRTSYPLEWNGAFTREKRYVILHIKGEKQCRRLHGWPEEWPELHERGHFIICEPEWLLDDGRRAPLHGVKKMLIAATDVEMVEFLKEPKEIAVDEKEMKRVEELLISEQKKGEDHGKEVADEA
jgi:hypothetical protein